MNRTIAVILVLANLSICLAQTQAADPWIVLEGKDGPGKGKKIVLVSGDEEYRSEECLPQLGKILSQRYGFHCTIVFAIDPKDGTINPGVTNNIPGLEALQKADLMIIATRFRNLPDAQMKFIAEYIESKKPIIGLRTATHAFSLNKSSSYTKYTWNNSSKEYPGGFGKQILGETWVSHHGNHGKESTRGILAKDEIKNPILTGIKDGDIWGPTDVYGIRLPLAKEFKPLVFGQVLTGMKKDDPPVTGTKNDPMMPIAWIGTGERRVFTTTMGSSIDLESAGLRRLLVNAALWCTGLEKQIDATSSVEIVGTYKPLPFRGGGHAKGVKPEDLLK